MTTRPVKIPGPDHPITVRQNSRRVVVSLAGTEIASTRAALTLQEAHYPAVQYIPREDVNLTLLTKSATETYCPYKGVASYYSTASDGGRLDDAIWSYEAPYEAVAAIKGYMAFYPDRFDVIEESEG